MAALEQHPEDAPLTQLHLASQSSLDFTGSAVADKVTTLVGNSTTLDFSPWQSSIDFFFIDGGHDFETVKSDTENALGTAVIDKPSCIMWHDYRSLDYPALTCYLDDLSKDRDIFQIEDTKLCVWFNDPGNLILPWLVE